MLNLFLLISLACISLPAAAHPPAQRTKKIDFAEMKKTKLESLDRMRSCISNSNNFDELQACRRNMLRK